MAARKCTSPPAARPQEQTKPPAKKDTSAVEYRRETVQRQVNGPQDKLRRRDKALQQSEERFRLSYEYAPLGYQSLDADGCFLDVNPAWLRLLGYNREDVIGKWFGDFLTPPCRKVFCDNFPAVKAAEEIHGVEFDMLRKDGVSITVSFNSRIARDEAGSFLQTHCILHEVTAKKQAEASRLATIELLRLCQTAESTPDLIRNLTSFVQQLTQCQAVGVRLRDGPDFPYYETRGFPPEFVLAENRLCAVDQTGALVRDSKGNPVFECMCGNILCGRVDPSKPFFTPHGSFWTNCTTDLLAGTSEADRQGHTRNRCNGEGYESVALLPLCCGGETFGLVQLNDKRKGMFSPEYIAELETMIDYAAMALSQRLLTDSLKQSRDQYRRIIQTANEGIWAIDAERRTTYVNPQMAKIMGCAEQNLIGTRLTDWIPTEDRVMQEQRLRRRSQGVSEKYEQRFRRPDGTTVWCHISAAPLLDENRRFVGSFAMFTDITDRKKMEDAVRDSENRYHTVAEFTYDWETWRKPDGSFYYVSPACERISGYTPGDFIACPSLMDDIILPEYQETWKAHRLVSDKVEKLEEVQVQIRRRDGGVRWIEHVCQPVYDAHGDFQGYRGSNRDITERKLAEEELLRVKERLEMAQRAAGAGSWSWNQITGSIEWSDELFAIFGLYPGLAVASFETWSQLLHPEDRQAAEQRIDDAVRTHTPLVSEYRIVRPDGKTRWINALGRSTYDETGRATRMNGICIDITERKKAEEELRENERRLAADLEAMTSLHRIGSLFLHEGNLKSVLTEIVDAAIAISGADFGNIQLLDPEGATLRIAAHRGFPEWWIDFWNSVLKGQGTCGTALERGERVIVEDVEQSEIFVGTAALETQRKAGVRAVQSTPLTSRSGRPLGMFSTHYKRPHRPDDRSLRLLDLLARNAADIIERAQTAQALSESESRLRIATSSSDTGLWDWDLRSNEVYYSPIWKSQIGYEDHEIPNRFEEWQCRIHPDDLERTLASVRALIESRRPDYEVEFRLRHKDGSYRWILAKAAALLDEHGKVCRMLGSHIDITDRKRAEESLREQRNLLASVIEGTNVGTWRWNVQTGETQFNERWAGIVGYTLEELAPVSIQTWLDLAHPDDLKESTALLERHFAKTVDHYDYECRMRHKNGSWVWVHDRGKVSEWTSDGKPLLMTGTHTDITERKKAEDQLRSASLYARNLLEASLDPLITISPEGKITDVNRATEEVTGVSRQQLVGSDFSDYFVEPDKAREGYQQVLSQGLVRDYPLTIRHVSSKTTDVLYNATLYRDRAGAAQGVFAAARDVTERKQAEQELRESEANLAAAQRLAKIGSWTWEVPPDRARWSDETYRIFGIKPADLKDHRQSFLNCIHPEDRSRVDRALADALAGVREYDLEYRIQTPSGEEKIIHAQAEVSRSSDGRPVTMRGTVQDITERKQAEQVVRESEERFRNIFEHSPLGIVIARLEDRRILQVNEQMCRLVGYTREELTHRTIEDITHPDDMAPQAVELDEMLARRRTKLSREKRYICKDGTIRWVHLIGTTLAGASGQPSLSFGIVEDITEQRAAEEAIRNEKDKAQRYLDVAGVMMVAIDSAQRTILINKKACQILGCEENDAIGANWFDTFLPEDDRDIIRGGFNDLMAGRIEPWEYVENLVLTRDGNKKLVAWHNIVLRDENGRITGTLSSGEDISERKAAEEERTRLATAIEQVAEAVVITDANGTIQYVNPAFEDITGYEQAEVIGQNPRLLKSGRQNREFYQELWDTIKRGDVWNGRFTNRRKDGTLYEEEAMISPVVDQAGTIVNFVGVKRDVTLELALADQLRQAQKMEAVGQLAAGVAHDFDNLLTAIYGYVELARKTIPPDHAAVESLCGIESVAKQGNAVTRGLLTFSGRLATEKEAVELGGVLQAAIQLLRRLLPASIMLDADVAACPPLWVHADATQLQQIVLNLAINARDAMPGGGRLTITMRPGTRHRAGERLPPDHKSEPTAVVEINDTGTGMTPEVKAHIFEPFFTTKPRGRGTGLGLAIVRGIVEEHAGWLEVESSLGAGSTFRLYLPSISAPTGAEAAPPATSPPHGHGEVVLLAEDDPYVRGMIVTTLQHSGYHVIPAVDGDELLARYQEHCGRLALLMLDIDLPGHSGLDCLARIRASHDQVPALLITAHAAVPSEALGPDDVLLHKPFHLRELMSTAAQLIGNNLPKDCVS